MFSSLWCVFWGSERWENSSQKDFYILNSDIYDWEYKSSNYPWRGALKIGEGLFYDADFNDGKAAEGLASFLMVPYIIERLKYLKEAEEFICMLTMAYMMENI